MNLKSIFLTTLGLLALAASAACTRGAGGDQAASAAPIIERGPAPPATTEATDRSRRAPAAQVEAVGDEAAGREAVQNIERVTAAASDIHSIRARIESRRAELRKQAVQRRQDAATR